MRERLVLSEAASTTATIRLAPPSRQPPDQKSKDHCDDDPRHDLGCDEHHLALLPKCLELDPSIASPAIRRVVGGDGLVLTVADHNKSFGILTSRSSLLSP